MEAFGFWIAPIGAVVIVGLCVLLAYYTRPNVRLQKRKRDF
jgi:hypothetical protein